MDVFEEGEVTGTRKVVTAAGVVRLANRFFGLIGLCRFFAQFEIWAQDVALCLCRFMFMSLYRVVLV